jgi:solute:Na+ symporter, SSS family
MTLFLTITGGWLTVMVVDCVEGLISGLFYLVVIGVLLYMFSWKQISEALATAPKGQSMLNPFDSMQTKDFNLWYVLIGIVGSIYSVGSWQGGSGFRAAATNAHEAKMAGVLASWRGYSKSLMFTLLGLCAFTYLRHADFSSAARDVHAYLNTIPEPQIRNQMQAPVAMAFLLPPGIKGVLAAIMLFAMMAGEGAYMHSWGSIFIQDIILPFRKTPFEPKQHIRLLRLAILGVAVFAFFFGLLYKQTDYIVMFFSLTGAIFSGAGAAIIGGLYWSRGTTAAAWASLLTGSTIAVSAIALQQGDVWPAHVAPWLLHQFPRSAYLQAHLDKFPINGQWMMLGAIVSAVTVYVVVSLLTCRERFNLDRMLHRGPYAVDARPGEAPVKAAKFTWRSLVGINDEFTRGDKFLSIGLFGWTMFWFVMFVVISIWNLFQPWPTRWWANYWHIVLILVPLSVGSVTTVWFTWGGLRDLFRAFAALKVMHRDKRDDGMVVNHHNLDEDNGKPAGTTHRRHVE